MENNVYQKRYIAHQKKKAIELASFMKKRKSARTFGKKEVGVKELNKIFKAFKLCPSSCDRKGVYAHLVYSRDEKELLSGILVGGVGWIHRADKIILFLTDGKAYRENLKFMPYLDAGVMVQQVYLVCTSLGMRCCFVNPNIREKYKKVFKNISGDLLLGAMAIGYK
jgi:nitroreductase